MTPDVEMTTSSQESEQDHGSALSPSERKIRQ